MAYTPKQFTGRKGVHDKGEASREDLFEIIGFLENEFANIARAFQEFTEVELRTVKKQPKRPQDGMIVSADGTSWNPGSGKGIYAYLSGAWVLLGGSGLTANTVQTPFYVVDEKSRQLLAEMVVEQKITNFILTTSLDFKLDTDTLRGLYFNSTGGT